MPVSSTCKERHFVLSYSVTAIGENGRAISSSYTYMYYK